MRNVIMKALMAALVLRGGDRQCRGGTKRISDPIVGMIDRDEIRWTGELGTTIGR
jgi:hypothetical protein